MTPLLLSARDFLIEAIENYDNNKLNFSIVHAVVATEIVLKERLSRIHPSLIFDNIDKINKKKTVSLSALPQRLINFGVSITLKDCKLIFTFAKWRNEIVHHMPSFDKNAARHQLPKLLDYISAFLRKELGYSLDSLIPTNLFKTVNGLLTEWEHVKSKVRKKAKNDKNIIPDACPVCGVSGVLSLRAKSGLAKCYMCGMDNYYYYNCSQCGKKTVSSLSPYDVGNYCDECVDAAGDEYIQNLIDIKRGK